MPQSPATPRPRAATAWFTNVAAHACGASLGLAAALAYDARFWLNLRGNELSLTRTQFVAAVAHTYALAWPIVLVAAVTFAMAESLAMRRGTPALLQPRAWLRPAADEIATTVVMIATIGGSVGAMLAVTTMLMTQLHSQRVIAILVAWASPFVVGAFVLLRRALTDPVRRYVRGLDGAASPLVFYVLVVPIVFAIRMRFAETDSGLDHSVPWYTVWTVIIGGLVHAFVAFSLPRSRRVRIAGATLVLAGVVGSTLSIELYDRTTSQRAFVEDISWVGSRAHRVWSEILDRDGDGHPALLAGGDCDDRRSSVHPGAYDVRGDHVDSDCFGGDGTPRFDDRAPMVLSPREVDDRPLNIVMISIDAMRPDRLRAAGSRRTITPRLDRLVTESVWFRDVTSPSPRTVRSLPAVFTGQYPGAVEYVRSLGRVDMDESAVTLAELLSTRMDTVAVLGTTYFRDNMGLLQGFTNVEHAGSMKPAPEWATDRALAQLERMRSAPRPTLLWVHYFGAHEPYLADRFPSRFGAGPANAYDTELWRADHEVGRLLDGIRARGLETNTAVVVFSDHGEALGEHGAWGHSTRLTEEQVRSVLMIRAPRVTPRVVDTPVALFDLFPTLCDMGYVAAPSPISARNLTPALHGAPRALVTRPLFSEVLPDAIYAIETQSIREGWQKLIYFPRTQRAAYYDLRTDPHELHDLADTHRSGMRSLLGTLLEWNVASHLDANRISTLIRDSITRALPPGVPRIDAAFTNGMTLVGARIDDATPPRDGIVPVDLYFRTDRPIASDYFIHLTFDPADRVSNAAGFVAHHSPVEGSYATSMWRPGEVIRDRVYVRIPESVQPNVPLIGHVEVWSHFHVRMPVTAVIAGQTTDTVDIGTMLVR